MISLERSFVSTLLWVNKSLSLYSFDRRNILNFFLRRGRVPFLSLCSFFRFVTSDYFPTWNLGPESVTTTTVAVELFCLLVQSHSVLPHSRTTLVLFWIRLRSGSLPCPDLKWSTWHSVTLWYGDLLTGARFRGVTHRLFLTGGKPESFRDPINH